MKLTRQISGAYGWFSVCKAHWDLLCDFWNCSGQAIEFDALVMVFFLFSSDFATKNQLHWWLGDPRGRSTSRSTDRFRLIWDCIQRHLAWYELCCKVLSKSVFEKVCETLLNWSWPSLLDEPITIWAQLLGKTKTKKKAEINLSGNHTTEKLEKTQAIVYPCIGPEMVVALSCGFFLLSDGNCHCCG